MSNTPRTNALADLHGDVDPDNKLYWSALDLATELEHENFTLAAGLCLHGLKGDDHGNPYCPRILQLENELTDKKYLVEALQKKLAYYERQK